ncbi:MAG: DUF4366 domain-containing protein [Oscillospiraceae bacterium]|nr:DUF4366 domain-containing protein [Oscillospiraceae bacterium]
MKNKGVFRLLTAMLLLVVCLSAFPMTALAYSDEGSEESAEEPVTGGIPLTPEGNMTLVDDIHGEAAGDKQFITVVSKSGNYFYIIIDRAANGENTVHFLNKVDEADLMALMDEDPTDKPLVCTCSEKCKAGAVNTSCEICMTNMSRCAGREATPTPTEPAEPVKESSSSALWALVLILAAGGGAAYYFVVMKPKQVQTVPSDLDDLDLEDEEELSEEDTAYGNS